MRFRSPELYNSRTNQRKVEIFDVVANSGVISHDVNDAGLIVRCK